eukprot:5472592-Pleurochrysis_carterae.AAC.3
MANARFGHDRVLRVRRQLVVREGVDELHYILTVDDFPGGGVGMHEDCLELCNNVQAQSKKRRMKPYKTKAELEELKKDLTPRPANGKKAAAKKPQSAQHQSKRARKPVIVDDDSNDSDVVEVNKKAETRGGSRPLGQGRQRRRLRRQPPTYQHLHHDRPHGSRRRKCPPSRLQMSATLLTTSAFRRVHQWEQLPSPTAATNSRLTLHQQLSNSSSRQSLPCKTRHCTSSSLRAPRLHMSTWLCTSTLLSPPQPTLSRRSADVSTACKHFTWVDADAGTKDAAGSSPAADAHRQHASSHLCAA